ncbi:expressed unknown protein [Seminavis robusta]|uniref:Uncharacterized protein n=1 Tax=Seminavis robusta TaxID=568900 RepID=A0A9N8F0G4_9STRA|nr:expressed unknown protein [Seminavis robusta]|eukprot:Sro2865_g338930.1 n/a (140) ;mRNA; r:5053-5472
MPTVTPLSTTESNLWSLQQQQQQHNNNNTTTTTTTTTTTNNKQHNNTNTHNNNNNNNKSREHWRIICPSTNVCELIVSPSECDRASRSSSSTHISSLAIDPYCTTMMLFCCGYAQFPLQRRDNHAHFGRQQEATFGRQS